MAVQKRSIAANDYPDVAKVVLTAPLRGLFTSHPSLFCTAFHVDLRLLVRKALPPIMCVRVMSCLQVACIRKCCLVKITVHANAEKLLTASKRDIAVDCWAALEVGRVSEGWKEMQTNNVVRENFDEMKERTDIRGFRRNLTHSIKDRLGRVSRAHASA